jgi:hypothetical protein
MDRIDGIYRIRSKGKVPIRFAVGLNLVDPVNPVYVFDLGS